MFSDASIMIVVFNKLIAQRCILYILLSNVNKKNLELVALRD